MSKVVESLDGVLSYVGVDSSIDESLFEYGFVVSEEEDRDGDHMVYYQVDDNKYRMGYISNNRLDEIYKDLVEHTDNDCDENFYELSIAQKIHTLAYDKLTHEDVFGVDSPGATYTDAEVAVEVSVENISLYEREIALSKFLDVSYRDVFDMGDQTFQDDNNDEYLVLTEDEADQKFGECMDDYINDCVLPEIPEAYRSYFNSESFKRDAKMDGREMFLATYDHIENEATYNDTVYYIYRIN
ncbi:MAG: hypothetical protein ACRDD8_06400 [Bacteroidales bacterium]